MCMNINIMHRAHDGPLQVSWKERTKNTEKQGNRDLTGTGYIYTCAASVSTDAASEGRAVSRAAVKGVGRESPIGVKEPFVLASNLRWTFDQIPRDRCCQDPALTTRPTSSGESPRSLGSLQCA